MFSEDPIAERVREVMDSSGLTQAQFALKAGLDGPKLSKSLNGARRFTSLDLARIADLGGVTVDWLLGHDRQSPSLAARAHTNALSSTDHAVQHARRYAQLRADMAFLGYRQDTPEIEGKQAGGEVSQGAELARRALAHAAVDMSSSRDLAELIEDHFSVDVAIVEMPDGFDGLALRDAHSRLIVVGTSKVPARQRFTIAHELGHLLAEDDQDLHVDSDVMDTQHKKRPSERRANVFAATFLMPEDLVRELAGPVAPTMSDDAFATLAVRLLVSPSTLAWRLQNLNIISPTRRQELMTMSTPEAAKLAGTTGSFADWITQASQPRVPSGLVRCTFQAYLDGKATLRPLANLLGTDTATLRVALEDDAEGQQRES